MRRALAAVVAVALLAAAPATAHRGHSSLSVVEIDGDSGAVTVVHRIAAHDVEPFLVRLTPDAQPSLDDQAAFGPFRVYAGRALKVWDAEGRPVALTFVEEDVGFDEVRLTYRGALPTPARRLSLDSDLMQEGADDQENQVNVRRAGVTRTAVFRAGSPRVSFVFEG